jgi:hypothetical protein
MSIAIARNTLLWCTLINYGLLLVWAVIMLLPHGWQHRLWCRRFAVSAEQFNAISYAGIVLYKLLILMFNLVPYIALRIAG